MGNTRSIQRETPGLAGNHLTKQDSPIFKLNIDCLYEILDYLSLKDVHSFAQTCVAMQIVIDEYLQQNFGIEARIVDSEGVLYRYGSGPLSREIVIQGFNDCIERLKIENGAKSMRPFPHFKNLTAIRFHKCTLDEYEIEIFREIIKRAESIVFEKCDITYDFIDKFPELCANLKSVYWLDLGNDYNNWLLQKYPKLEHIQWPRYKRRFVVTESYLYALRRFFAFNPQCQSLTIDIESLYLSKGTIIESNVKLNDLGIEVDNRFHSHPNEYITKMFNVLEKLYEQGVYKRLHFHLCSFNSQVIKSLIPAHAVRSLWLRRRSKMDIDAIDLPELENLVELRVSSLARITDWDSFSKQLRNLKRIYFEEAEIGTVLSFFRHSVRLKKFKVNQLKLRSLDLSMLNAERKKLAGACKVAIYVNEYIYSATKWDTNAQAFELVEIRRASSEDIRNVRFVPWETEIPTDFIEHIRRRLNPMLVF